VHRASCFSARCSALGRRERLGWLLERAREAILYSFLFLPLTLFSGCDTLPLDERFEFIFPFALSRKSPFVNKTNHDFSSDSLLQMYIGMLPERIINSVRLAFYHVQVVYHMELRRHVKPHVRHHFDSCRCLEAALTPSCSLCTPHATHSHIHTHTVHSPAMRPTT
jgi:hypothetical protein